MANFIAFIVITVGCLVLAYLKIPAFKAFVDSKIKKPAQNVVDVARAPFRASDTDVATPTPTPVQKPVVGPSTHVADPTILAQHGIKPDSPTAAYIPDAETARILNERVARQNNGSVADSVETKLPVSGIVAGGDYKNTKYRLDVSTYPVGCVVQIPVGWDGILGFMATETSDSPSRGGAFYTAELVGPMGVVATATSAQGVGLAIQSRTGTEPNLPKVEPGVYGFKLASNVPATCWFNFR